MRVEDRRIRSLCQSLKAPTLTQGLNLPVVNLEYRDPSKSSTCGSCTNNLKLRCRPRYLFFWLLASLLLLKLWFPLDSYMQTQLSSWAQLKKSSSCPQVGPISPSKHVALLEGLEKTFETEGFKINAYKSLGGAVRIPTETHDDDNPPGEDSRWEVFARYHEYLHMRFPLAHSRLDVTKVNTYALVYHWQGSDTSLKPVLLTAHQDVVPVEPQTASQWIQPPFSGYYDGEWLWGRGSCDDKSGLMASLTAVETLLEKAFKPTRSIVLAYGFDEEKGGVSGATAIRDFLLLNYGEGAFSILVDEGGGYTERYGATFVALAVAEKGKFDMRMEVSAPGGHSSIPPFHTSIGMLARLIKELEANPHPSSLQRNTPYYQSLQCFAEHGPTIPPLIRRLTKESQTSDKALRRLDKELSKMYRSHKASVGTTQAVDVVRGGVKANALPEVAYAIVNHRIADYSSVTTLKSRIRSTVIPVAKTFNISVDAFGHLTNDTLKGGAEVGHLQLSDAFGTALEPAPITPTGDSGAWVLLSGTILSTLGTSQRQSIRSNKVYVTPGLMLANTDTRHYWRLTPHIFRYSHQRPEDMYNGAHTVNEAIRAEGYLEMIRFFTMLILNADETTLLE